MAIQLLWCAKLLSDFIIKLKLDPENILRDFKYELI